MGSRMERFAAGAILWLLVVQQVACSGRNALDRKHLKIATVALPAYMHLKRTVDGRLVGTGGLAFQMVDWLSKRFHFTYSLVEPADQAFGLLVNDSWTGMIRMVHDHEVDLAAGPFTPTTERAAAVHFTSSYVQDPLGVLIPAPRPDSQLLAIIKPFQFEVWMLLIAAMFSVSWTTWLLMRLSRSYLPPTEDIRAVDLSYKQHVMFALRILCSQAQSLTTSTSHATRLAASTWCLTSVVFVYLYSGCLTSYIAVPKLYPAVNSMEELAANGHLQLMVYSGTYLQGFLLEAASGKYKVLGDSLRRYPANNIQLNETDEAVNRVISGRFALSTEKSMLKSEIEEDLKATGTCRLALMKEDFFSPWECFVMPKDSPYKQLIDEGIQEMQVSGLLEHWRKLYWPKPNRCTSSRQQEHPPTAILSLRNLLGAFVLYISGLGVSTVFFVVEILVLTICRRNGSAVENSSDAGGRDRN